MSAGTNSAAAADEEEDDDGYAGYVPSAVNLGGGLLAGAIFAFVVAYFVILPVAVVMGGRREARRKALEQSHIAMDQDEDGECESGELLPENNQTLVELHKHSAENININSNNSSSSSNDEEVQTTTDESTTSHKPSSPGSSSELSSAVAAILSDPRVPRNKTQRKRRRRKEKQRLEATGWRTSANNNRRNNNGNDPQTVSLMQAIHPGAVAAVALPVASGSSCSEMEDDFLEDTVSRPDFSATLAPSDNMAGYPHLQRTGDFSKLGVLDKITTISAWDMETKRIIKLAMPYCTQAFITGVLDILTVSVIGTQIGTKEVSAYVIVNLLVELTSEFVGGFHEALATLCSQAIGVGNKQLAGQYVQIVTILYTAFFIPFMIIWAVYMGAALRWLGFDEETVRIGTQYTYILIVDLLFDGVGEAIHSLLDVGGLENFSTLIGATEEILAFILLLLVALFGNPGLVTVGLIQFYMGVIFLVLNVGIIYWRGWFLPYQNGLIGSFALWNGKAVWLVCKTAMSLSFGMLLSDGEWEILTILASVMGPAEVVAWGILDTIWQGTHELIDGIADAGEVRCAFLLGCGYPERAKLSAYKSMLVGTFAALFLTSFIYIAGEDLPTWLTNDPALQHILKDLLPLFGLGNLVMALDTMSWTLLGSQGRYRLATIIVCLVSWFVTLPLAVLFTVGFNVNLEGQMTGFILGYLVMGVAHMYFLLRSDWQELCKTVMEDNAAVQQLVGADVPTNFSTSTSTTSRKPASQSASSTLAGSRASLPMTPIETSSSTLLTGVARADADASGARTIF